MNARLLGFGEIEVEGKRYDADVVIDRGSGPPAPQETLEALPQSVRAYPAEVRRRNVEIVALPTEAACRLIAELGPGE